MTSFVQLFVIAAAIATSYGQILNVTSEAQDYYLLSQRELLHDIEIVQLKTDSIDARYADRLDVVQSQQQQLLIEIHQVNTTLMPLQALGLVRKHCIQKFDSQLVTYDNAKQRLKVCYDRAVLTGISLTTGARSNIGYATNYVVYTLPKNVASCDSTYSKNQTALELCYINNVDSTKSSVKSYLDLAQVQLDKALYDSAVASNTVVQCSFLVEKDTLETIGQTTKAIDECELSLKKKNSAEVLSDVESKSVQSLIMGKIRGQ